MLNGKIKLSLILPKKLANNPDVYKEFFKKVNPRRIRRTATMPRLRCLRDCVTQFNKDYPNRKIDKATVSRYMKSKTVTRYFHGNTWFINYDELEKVLLRNMKPNKSKTK